MSVDTIDRFAFTNVLAPFIMTLTQCGIHNRKSPLYRSEARKKCCKANEQTKRQWVWRFRPNPIALRSKDSRVQGETLKGGLGDVQVS